MNLVGTNLAQYRVTGRLGAGGMGEVFRAVDTRLGRQVAIKVLPEAVATDPERLARLRREARLLAALNHPNVAAIHGLEERADGAPYLVLELVDGPTLKQRLAAGSLPLDEATSLARQIVAGLAAAHEQGIVHRDLKPANLAVNRDGRLKILDFGLAKDGGRSPQDDWANAPTRVRDASTAEGLVVGTAAYMSPEQVRGLPVDARTDIWAFGCVVYEMLSGRPAFTGATGADVMSAVLSGQPDWSRVAGFPTPLRRLLRRCLAPDADRRLHHIADAGLELDEAATDSPMTDGQPAGRRSGVGTQRRSAGVLAVAGLAAVAAAFLFAARVLDPPRASPSPIRLVTWLDPELGPSAIEPLAMAPDGGEIVFTASSAGGTDSRLHRKAMDADRSTPIEGTESGYQPFFSADGHWLAFRRGAQLLRMPRMGGAPRRLAEIATWGGGSWFDDTIVLGNIHESTGAGLHRISVADGRTSQLLAARGFLLDDPEQALLWPHLLPGGEAVLFTSFNTVEDMSVDLLVLATGERRTVVEQGCTPRYLPTGHLVYWWQGDLMAVAFDLRRYEARGTPVPVVRNVRGGFLGLAAYVVSEDGLLVYERGGPPHTEVVLVDHDGGQRVLPLPPARYSGPRFSPDGRRLVISREHRRSHPWIYDIHRGTLRRATRGSAMEYWPLWSPAGNRLYFNSNLDGGPDLDLATVAADGSEDAVVLLERPGHQQAWQLTPDGADLLFVETSADGGADILRLPLGGGEPVPILKTAAREFQPAVSPDGAWLAYAAAEADSVEEVLVRRLDGSGGVVQISIGGGRGPVWSGDGRWLYFRTLSGDIYRAEIRPGTGSAEPVTVSLPERVATGRWIEDLVYGRNYDVSPDGSRFIVLRNAQPDTAGRFVVVVHWFEELETLLADVSS